MQQMVITAVGPDRPGLVEKLTGYLLDAGANVADSRMVNLRGQFALILLAEVPKASAATSQQGIVDAGAQIGLSVQVTPASGQDVRSRAASGGAPGGAGGVPWRLRTYAMDQPGLVHRITQLLHRHGVNIEELETHLEPGSYTGTPLFTMSLRMTVPTTVPVKTLRTDLESLCDTLNCDMDLDPA